jgi:methylthioribose-1-phosphate isomerase
LAFRSIEWLENEWVLRLIDQTRLPEELTYIDLADPHAICAAIREMKVRGAPAIGVAAAYAMVAAAGLSREQKLDGVRAELSDVLALLRASRPTAVNLFWALDRMEKVMENASSISATRENLLVEAQAIEAEDVAVNQAISRHAMEVVPQKATIFHHCNTGSLATVDLGTALGVIRTAHESGREVFAYLDETRPRLQGAKLSAWELMQYGVPHAVVVDGAAPHIMRTKGADLCVVGCDRVAANGDVANKIGTYALALAAKDNQVPFYVCAPTSTIDMDTASGDDIAIEDRDPHEVTHIDGKAVAAEGASAYNPAFDVTPARLISGIVTEYGIARAPYEESLFAIMSGNG